MDRAAQPCKREVTAAEGAVVGCQLIHAAGLEAAASELDACQRSLTEIDVGEGLVLIVIGFRTKHGGSLPL